jgi:hypothetical protein
MDHRVVKKAKILRYFVMLAEVYCGKHFEGNT